MAQKITVYIILTAYDVASPEHQVQQKIDEGWQPLGSPDFSTNSFGQALIRYQLAEPR